MRIQIASDLHLESYRGMDYIYTNPLQKTGDVLVLAGDVTQLNRHDDDEFREVLDTWKFMYDKIIYVPGNHEYYRGDFGEKSGSFHEIDGNVHFLNNDVVEYQDVRFICSTFWSGVTVPTTRCINDYFVIKGFDMTVENEAHKQSVEFVKNELEKSYDGKTVVVTHHLPLEDCVSEQYKGNPINDAFSSHNPELFEYDIDLWVHGHSHDHSEIEFNGVKVVRNPLGYGSHETRDFDRGYYVEV